MILCELREHVWRERQNERLIHECWQCVSGSSDSCFFEYRTVSAGTPRVRVSWSTAHTQLAFDKQR